MPANQGQGEREHDDSTGPVEAAGMLQRQLLSPCLRAGAVSTFATVCCVFTIKHFE